MSGQIDDKGPYRSLLNDDGVMEAVRNRFGSGEEIPDFGTPETAGVTSAQLDETIERGPVQDVPMNALEAIILLTGRPALLIQDGDFLDPDLEEMKRRLDPRRDALKGLIPSVARLDVVSLSRNHAGTAWMLDEDVMVTNRHVAVAFARDRGGEFVFRRRPSGLEYQADVDFYREYQREARLLVEIEEVLHMEPDEEGRPDMALVRVARNPELPAPLQISSVAPQRDEDVVTIGYPGNAPRSNDPTALEDYFGQIYGVKRLSPGRVSVAQAGQIVFNHDCTTLGGNSGSPVIRLETGEVVGLHFAGIPESNNWAVTGPTLRQRLDAVRGRVLVSVPAPYSGSGKAPAKGPSQPEQERVSAADLESRSGYDTEFLNDRVPLPTPTGDLAARQVEVPGRADGVLDYTHYSVAMHRDRRLAMYTACNIDGGRAFRPRRGRDSWQTDPRIPDDLQADNELYRRNPLDRGHLVRRLDTAWGENREEAQAAAEDTYFYTNAAPQHASLNQRTWLGLEDYVLDNADNHDVKVTVFTGPVFRDSDREYRGFHIPEDFWKVLVFANDETGELSATAYLLTQSDFLSGLEFVFGEYETYQVAIADIENLTSLDFHFLRGRDPLGAEGTLEGALPVGHRLTSLEDVLL